YSPDSMDIGAPAAPLFPLPPPGMSRGELKRWYRTQRRLAIRTGHLYIGPVQGGEKYDDQPLEDRVIAFRRSAVTFIVFTPILLAINAATEGVPWFIVP